MSTTSDPARTGTAGGVGAPIDRVDGRQKVTGAARYSADHVLEGLVHAVLVQSIIASGRIARLDASGAEAAPGVLDVITHLNAPELPTTRAMSGGGFALQAVTPLQDDRIRHAGENVALVVAETLEQAQHAARLIRVEYDEHSPRTELREHGEQVPSFVLSDYLEQAYPPQGVFGNPPDHTRGDPDGGLLEAEVRVDETYTTPIEHHNPMEPAATIAVWQDDGALTVYETTQGVTTTRMALAQALGLPRRKVRVVSRFLGGGFGCKGPYWPHTTLAAVAARRVGRPVKLVLTRAQMYTSVGYRPETVQRVRLGARQNGTLTATIHHSTSTGSEAGELPEPAAEMTKMLYSCPNLVTRHRLVKLNMGVPSLMRAPGEASGSFALESALDELAYELGMDPIRLRLRNYAEVEPDSGKPWSSKALRACYEEGAERFGWEQRDPEPRSMRDGRWLVGWGMATAAYSSASLPAMARVRILSNGRAIAQSGTQDLETGTYTVMAQVASDTLGLPPDRITFELGDTTLPFALTSVSSSTARSVGPAVRAAAEAAKRKALNLAVRDRKSPLYGAKPEAVGAAEGELFLKADPSRRDTYAAILSRRRMDKVEARRIAGLLEALHGIAPAMLPSVPGGLLRATTSPFAGKHSTYDFGAQYVEVRVDPDLGIVRLSRALGVFDIGTVLNPKTARSQAIGGITWGLGMALLEQSPVHAMLGKFVSPNLSGYLVPTNADVPAIDAFFVGKPDPNANPLGVKGVGELPIVGVAAAIANAVYHATGKRIRDLPITPEKLL